MTSTGAVGAKDNPRTLLDQYKLLGAVIDSDWAKGREHKVAYHVIDRFMKKYGTARISLRELEKRTGASRPRIIESLERLTEHDVLRIARKGEGTRATEYALNFEYGKLPSGDGSVPSTDPNASGDQSAPSEGTELSPLEAPSGYETVPESYLRGGLTSPLTEGKVEPSPLCGLTPALATGGFEELWNVYGRKQRRADAKAAYEKLKPNPELHNELVKRAVEWHTAYESLEREPQYRKCLHTWINEECWKQDAPETPIKRKTSESKSGAPLGRHAVEIIRCDIPNSIAERIETRARIKAGELAGREFDFEFILASNDDALQEVGQKQFSAFRSATGIEAPEDTSEFVGQSLIVTVKRGGRMEFEAI